MKIIVFNGSPAGADSNTNVIAEAFLQGVAKAGGQTENIFLTNLQIGHCRGCFACWFKTPGQCVIRDDMAELIRKYDQADIVCFATPVYTWNMTAMLKNFVDRLAPLKSPLLVRSGDDFDLTDTKIKEQQFMVIANCGFPGDNNFNTIRSVFASCHPVMEIYRNCGKLLRSKDPVVKEVVREYLQQVGQAGFEMAGSGLVSDETRRRLEMQLMSVADYVKYIGM